MNKQGWKSMLTNDGAKVGRAARLGATRRRLLDAAYSLLVKDGYQAATLQGVARRAGLSTGAIYGHFLNKQELMAAAVLDRWSYLQADVAAPGNVGATWPDHPLVDHIARHLAAPSEPIHQLLTEVTGAVLRDEGEAASPLLASVRVLHWSIRVMVDQAKEDGAIDRRLRSDAVAAVILNAYLGSITAKAWGIEQPDLEDVADVLSAINCGLADGPADRVGVPPVEMLSGEPAPSDAGSQ